MENLAYLGEMLKMLGVVITAIFVAGIVITILFRGWPEMSSKFRLPKEWAREGARIDAEIEKQRRKR